MSQAKPVLKLKLKSGSLSSAARPQDASPADIPASATSTSTPKIKLKVGKKQTTSEAPTSTPPTAQPPKKAKRAPKPTPKKRAAEEEAIQDDSESDQVASISRPIKKIKLTSRAPSSSGTTSLKIKAKGKPLKYYRPYGVGYDSEASDQEDDPTIIEQFILRMQPGEDCDYLRAAVTNRNFGKVSEGGADVKMRFLSKDGRRAAVIIRKKIYAAILVDLPCIIEAMKSWEKKNFWKSADICQMLLVLGVCRSEEEAERYPLPTKGGSWMRRRGSGRMGLRRRCVRAVEEDEKEVERLLKADRDCVPGTSRYRVFESVDDYDREQSMANEDVEDSEDEDEDADAEGEVDEPQTVEPETANAGDDDDDDDIFAMEMEKEMAAHADKAAATASASVAATPQDSSSAPQSPAMANVQAMESPAAATTSGDEDEEEEESDEDEDDATLAEDPDAVEAAQELQRQKEEIADLEAAISREREALNRTANAILRSKIVKRLEGLEGDLEGRRRALGGEEGEGE
ncbi:uncharacterized protein KY384_004061 [Bacidia gigantensis]|uniref:uncharacterized protein n=1 Tax=Bacidia gigantensis TaxID=2732470 RepID=UPI001D03D724|nr:uncharacterized protein KY384_004061 [Bacidia gigantensis]KAG8530705.1 hypothetical protein KY384_004061 [Bacidia gigantensis]